ncbi:MAG TPA: LPXTG cell wall anchor domain-containing protein [Rubrobacteraceae bacterium]|nr:LPXTG cell wall anchor domain-containing protein [Rubrobacteraceae bacterium]
MKKLVLLGALVAMVVVAAAPALAQVSQEQSERRITSGKSSPSFSVSNKGNNANLCPTGQQVGQTGQVANEQGAVQYKSTADDIDFAGSSLTITPDESATCTQTIEQAAAAGPKAEAKAGKAEAKGGEAKAGAPEAKAGGAEAKAGELPKTGGIAGTASLLGLGAGALLVAGGLLARRIIR